MANRACTIGRREEDDAASSSGAAGLAAPGSAFERGGDRALDHGSRDDRRQSPASLPLLPERLPHPRKIGPLDRLGHGPGSATHAFEVFGHGEIALEPRTQDLPVVHPGGMRDT